MTDEVRMAYKVDRLADSIEFLGIETEEEWNQWMAARSESFESQIEAELTEMELDA